MDQRLLAVARIAVFVLFCGAAFVAAASWLVRTRRVSPFGPLGRGLRRITDAVMRPVEARLVRLGGHPTHAGWWLVIGVAVAGLLALSLLQWGFEAVAQAGGAVSRGPRGILRLGAGLVYDILVIALIVRVAGSWFGAFRYNRWVRPAYALTDWLVEPIRRALPIQGALDWSPLAAWLLLYLLRALIFRVLP